MQIIVERKYRLGYYTIGVMTVEGKSFRCNTLEPTDRGLVRKENEAFADFAARVRSVKAEHLNGETAIPYGTYDVKMHMSSRFKSYRPYLIGVPGFEGIMIHEGNTRYDTHGCLLVGNNTQKGMVLNSRATLKRLMDLIWAAEEDGEPIEITII